MNWPTFPAVYEINTWIWLQEFRREAKDAVTLGNVPDAELQRIADFGFDAVWLMGVWHRSRSGRQVARLLPTLEIEYRRAPLWEMKQPEVGGSGWSSQPSRGTATKSTFLGHQQVIYTV